MDTTKATMLRNKLQTILNAWKGLKDLEEILDGAVASQRLVVEADLERDAIRKEIGALKGEHGKAAKALQAEKAKAQAEWEKHVAKMSLARDDLNRQMADLHQAIAQDQESYASLIKESEAKLADLQLQARAKVDEAAAAEQRLETAEKKLAKLKAAI